MATFESIAEDELLFTALRAEWSQLTRAMPSTADWDARIAAVRDDEALVRAKGGWREGPANLFAILGIARRETYHSAMIAWLLNPVGHHGLGAAFLTIVLRDVVLREVVGSAGDPVLAQLPRARVRCEESREDCRVDIVLRSPGLTLVIENKVDAGEQPEQCARYVQLYGHEHGARFVYLTPDGRKPATDGAGAFALWSYRTLAVQLSRALESADRSARGWAVADHYAVILREEFT